MTKKLYQTPNGEYVSNVDDYIASWDEIRVPLERVLGLRTIRYNPGFLMQDTLAESRIVDVPVWLARRILANICVGVPTAE